MLCISTYRGGKKLSYRVNTVTLRPPNAWNLDFVGEEDGETRDYRLTKLGARRTRLRVAFRERYKVRGAPTKAEDTKHTSEMWHKYVIALERGYRRKAKP